MSTATAQAVQAKARAFITANPDTLVYDLTTLPLYSDFQAFQAAVDAAPPATQLSDLAKMVNNAFSQSASALVASSEFTSEKLQLDDSVVLIVLLPEYHLLPLDQMTDILRLMDLIQRIADQDTILNAPGELQNALNKTILLPPSIFPLRTDIPYPRMGDLLIVNQNLKRYEMGEIGSIENILLGESRKHKVDHTLSLDKTDTTSTDNTTETTDELDTTEQFQLTNEAQNVINEDMSAQAGLNLTASYGPVTLNTTANFAYNQSKSQSNQSSVQQAKSVTSRAVKNITQNVYQQEIARRTETFADTETHNFNNTGSVGQKNISGLYQWLNKIYEAQVFNYGQRMLIDLTIPEPAAFLLNAVTTSNQTSAPIAPPPFLFKQVGFGGWAPLVPYQDLNPDGTLKAGLITRPVNPSDLSLDPNLGNYYGAYAALYGATGITAPPELQITVSKAYTQSRDQNNQLSVSDTLTIKDGYQAKNIKVNGVFIVAKDAMPIDGDERMWVFVGKTAYEFSAYRGQNGQPSSQTYFPPSSVPSFLTGSDFPFKDDPPFAPIVIDEVSSIPVAIQTSGVASIAVNVDITCFRTEAAMDTWLNTTHGTIMQAYLKLVGDYQDKQAGQSFTQPSQGPLGGNPDINQDIIKMELKKACVALLTDTDIQFVDQNFNASDFNGVDLANRFLPQQSASPTAKDQGAYIQFFEQAFEWENITYLFYPYFWGRKSTWQTNALQTNTDKDFLDFLKAGSARVVIPIRPKLEPLALYYLMTGQIWGGGNLNGISDAYYLPISDEIKAQEGADDTAVPQGDPWEVKVPTTLLKLRGDDSLPIWQKYTLNSSNVWAPGDSSPAGGTELWVPGEMKGDTWQPDYGKLDDNGNFSES